MKIVNLQKSHLVSNTGKDAGMNETPQFPSTGMPVTIATLMLFSDAMARGQRKTASRHALICFSFTFYLSLPDL